MRFFPADYLADTRRLTTEQQGAYLLLLMDSWSSGALPDDDTVLARVAGLDAESWTRTRPAIARYFEITNGKWVHTRIEQEREHAQAYAQALHGKCPPEPEPEPDKTPVVNDDGALVDSSALAKQVASSFAGPAGLPEQSQRSAADTQRTRAGELCRLLRRQGLDANMDVTVQPGNPQVLAWVAAGVTDDEAAAACETALLNRRGQDSQQSITASYLDTIIAANRAAKATGGKNEAHRNRAAAAAAWGAEFAAEIGGAGCHAERCIDGEAVVIDASTAAG